MLLERCIATFLTLIGVVDALGQSTMNFHTSPLRTMENENSAKSGPQAYSVKVLKRLPHSGKPWTQGFEWMQMGTKGLLMESTGDFPAGTGSIFRALDPISATEFKRMTAPPGMFAEGITQKDNHFFMSSYTAHKILEIDEKLNVVQTYPYHFEGWGLTFDRVNRRFLTTNSTAFINYLDAQTLQLIDTKEVTCMGRSVAGLNELEYIANFFNEGPVVMGNIINTRLVLIINPETAKCVGTFHLENLEYIDQTEAEGYHVANGIAYDRSKGTYFVTGKNWNNIFEISLHRERIIGMHEADALLEAHLELAPAATGL